MMRVPEMSSFKEIVTKHESHFLPNVYSKRVTDEEVVEIRKELLKRNLYREKYENKDWVTL